MVLQTVFAPLNKVMCYIKAQNICNKKMSFLKSSVVHDGIRW